MSKVSLTTAEERTKRKALLVAKIYAERELISLQAQQLLHDVKPSTIKDNLVNEVLYKFNRNKTSQQLFSFIDRHPTVSWGVAQFLMRAVRGSRRSRSGLWRPLLVGIASWFISNRSRSKHRAAAADRTFARRRVRADSRPIHYQAGDEEALFDRQQRRPHRERAAPRSARRRMPTGRRL